jgi:hypothetical protein
MKNIDLSGIMGPIAIKNGMGDKYTSNKDKQEVLFEHNSKTILPIYVSYPLIILKYLYYTVGIIPKDTYKLMKRFLMNYLVEGKDVEFITTDIPKHKFVYDDSI